jgi:hypothetical protein
MAPNDASLPDESFIDYPINRVAGTIADRSDAEAAVEALLQAGIDADDIDVLHGDAGLQRLDPTGAGHGLLARFQRALIHVAGVNEESAALTRHVNDLRAGRFVIMVRARAADERQIVAAVLKAHRATFIGFFGRWTLSAMQHGGASHRAAADSVVNHTYEAGVDGSATRLRVEPGYAVEVTPAGLSPIRVTATTIAPGIFITAWQEPERNTVVQVNDTNTAKAYATIIAPNGQARQANGTLRRLD